METLTEPGALPVSRHPTSPCGFYPKQDSSAQYYFPNNPSHPQPPGNVPYSGFPQVPENDAWANSQNMRNHVFPSHQRRIEDRNEERIEKTEPYLPPTNSQSSPYHFNSSIQTQLHQPSRFAPPSSSLPLYPDDHISPSSRERDQRESNKHPDVANNTQDPHNKPNDTLISEKPHFRLHNSPEPNNYPGSQYNDNKQLLQYSHNRNSIYGGYRDDNNRVMYYHSDFYDTPHNLKGVYSSDSTGVISYNQSRKHLTAPKDTQAVDAEDCQDKIVYTEFRERIISSTLHKTTTTSRMMAKELQIDQGRQHSLTTISDHPMVRKDIGYNMSITEGKPGDFYKARDRYSQSTANNMYALEDKRAVMAARNDTSSLRDNQVAHESHETHSAKINTMTSSPVNSHTVNVGQRYHLTSSPQSLRHTPQDNPQSPTKNGSPLPGFTPGKLPLPPFSPIVELKYKEETLSFPQETPSSQSPLVSHLKNTPKEGGNKDYQKPSRLFQESIEMMDCEESVKNDGAIITQSPLAASDKPHPLTPPPQLHQHSRLSPEIPSKQSPPSPDAFAKTSEDESLDAKREIFSDDGDDDSACEDSMPHSPTFSPFQDSSIAYSQHFPHPFFPPQPNGPFSGLRFQFGPHDRPLPGVGFPFRSMPGMPQDMAGHMHASRSPFVGSAPPGVNLGRQLSGDSDIFFCHLCSYSGKSKNEFDIHMNTHFEFNCPHCDYTSRTEGRLKRHIKDFHSESSSRRSMPGRPKVYKCKQCQFSATEKDKFWAHSRTHIKEDKLLQCPKCPFVTEYKHHLEYHLRNHFGSKPFKCPKCNYSCVNKSMLNSHMKSHTNVYQYRCSECTYATKYCHSLKLHLKKYNHKPATVLNQDGSLPQGLDAGASGLSISTKRGPPRGPRGTIKDSNGPYMSHLFDMPQMTLGVGGINPILNGMIPFWPMLPQAGIHGHPSPQPGMLPEIRNLAQKMGIMADHRNITDCSKIDDTMEEISENSSEGCKSSIRDKDEVCKFCNFTAESRKELGLHLMRFHKEEAKEVIMSCGFSEAFLAESFGNANNSARLDKQHLSESLKESDSEHSSGEFQHRDSNTDFNYKEHSQFSQFKSDQKNESSKAQDSFRPQSLYPENYSGRDQEMRFNLVDTNNCKIEGGGSNSEIDILQQMTLKFGTEPLPDQKSFSTKKEANQQQITDGFNVSRKENIQRFHYTPLDLTKPKSVSPPPITNISPKLRDGDNNSSANDNEGIRSYSDDQFQCHSVDLESPVKGPMTEIDDRTNDNVAEISSVPPRKRSRKGKAYKLDTLCLKLQKRQVDTECDNDDLSSESTFGRLQNIHASGENERDNVSMNEPLKDTSIDNFHVSKTNIKHNSNIPANAGNYSDKGKNSSVLLSSYQKQYDGNLQVKEETIDMINDECSVITKNRQFVQEEAELELHKLQRSLSMLSPDLELTKVEKVTQQINTEIKNRVDSYGYHSDDNSSEATIEDETNLDNELNESLSLATQTSEKNTEKDNIDQAELINTVLENRKKAVPPEIRRGTELAWKLLNDPINPVTTLPLPADTLKVPQPSATSSVPSSGALIPPDTNNSVAVRKDLKPYTLSPQFPHHHPSIDANLLYARTPTSHPLNIPQPHRPQSHSHLQPYPPPMSMKPLMSVPIPSTPMAYIPPTNRMMSEPLTGSPYSRLKPSPKELYECTYCDLSFRDCVMYTVHMGYHSNQNPFQCNSCGAVSRDKVEFFLHIARAPHA